MEQFYLMNKDKKMALVECGAEVAKIVEVYSFFPFMTKMYNNLRFWFVDNRGIQSDFARNLKRSCGRSIKDTFWFREVGSELCWKDVSLFNPKNQKDHVLTKGSLVGPNERFVSNHDGKSWIVKEWSNSERNEGYAEHLAYAVGKKFGVNVASCLHSVQDGVLRTETEVFTGDRCIMVTLDEVFDNVPSFFDIFSFFKGLGERHLDEFRKLMVFDALIGNTDRNLRNMGILLNPDTGDLLGVAPSYEHSKSLLSWVSTEQLVDFEKKLECMHFRWGDPNLVAAFCRTKELESRLGDMLDFEFHFNPREHEKERRDILSSMIQYQAHNILNGIRNRSGPSRKSSLVKVIVEDEIFSLDDKIFVDLVDNHKIHTVLMSSKRTEDGYVLEPVGKEYLLEGDLLEFKILGIERKKVSTKGIFKVGRRKEIIEYGK